MVKYRARLETRTQIVTLNTDDNSGGCLADLKAEIKRIFDLENFDVSLNRKEPLVGDEKPLKELGLVPGDLVHILLKEDAQQAGHVSVSKPGKEPSKSVKSQPLCSTADTNTAAEQPGTSAGPHEKTNQETMEIEEEIQEQNSPPIPDSETNKYLNEPIVIRESTGESVPFALSALFKNSVKEIGDEHDALFVVLHLLMLETGFVSKDPCDSSEMPLGWKQAGGVKKSLYRSVPVLGGQEVNVTLLYIILGNTAKVYCTVENSSDAHTCQLSCDDYVKKLTQEASSTYKNLSKLSMLFKDKVSYQVLQSLYRDTVPNLLSVLNLSVEIQILILKNLTACELLKTSLVCRNLQSLAHQPVLWRRLYLLQFGKCTGTGENHLSQDWKNLYKTRHVERERTRQQEAEYRRYLSGYPHPNIPPHPGAPDSGTQFYPPGVIGGDFDRDPFFAGMPGAFGGGVGPMRPPYSLPRPRFDPVNPFSPDQRLMRPGRGGGMWEDDGLGGGGANRHNPGGHRLGGGGLGRGFAGGFGGPRMF